MPRSDEARICDIVEAAAERIARHIRHRTREEFDSDETVVRAVLFELAVIGEAAKGISEACRDRFPEVPWADVAGMRDVVIHQYFGIDLTIVWNAATVSVPAVIRSPSLRG